MLTFVKDGYIEMVYKKDTSQDNYNAVSGDLRIYVGDDEVLADKDLKTQDQWQYVKFDVKKGIWDITFIYEKSNYPRNID